MPDKREQILARLLVILDGLKAQGLKTVWRDRTGIEPISDQGDGNKIIQLPCALLLDGSESVVQARPSTTLGGKMGSCIMELQPQIFVFLMPREDERNEGVGEELSSWRIKVFKAIRDDDSLIALCGSNGGIAYRGCETDMQSGATIEGQIRIDFGFSYTLNPDQLS